MIREMQKRREEKEKLKQRLLKADEFDLEAQRLIADEIRQKNIDANMEAAMEFNPESFGTVVMLYIDCKVNGHPVKAFIDSGGLLKYFNLSSLLLIFAVVLHLLMTIFILSNLFKQFFNTYVVYFSFIRLSNYDNVN